MFREFLTVHIVNTEIKHLDYLIVRFIDNMTDARMALNIVMCSPPVDKDTVQRNEFNDRAVKLLGSLLDYT